MDTSLVPACYVACHTSPRKQSSSFLIVSTTRADTSISFNTAAYTNANALHFNLEWNLIRCCSAHQGTESIAKSDTSANVRILIYVRLSFPSVLTCFLGNRQPLSASHQTRTAHSDLKKGQRIVTKLWRTLNMKVRSTLNVSFSRNLERLLHNFYALFPQRKPRQHL